jgi:hypothetical protein
LWLRSGYLQVTSPWIRLLHQDTKVGTKISFISK